MNEPMRMPNARKGDPYVDRRSGDDRRAVYDSDYFASGGIERRLAMDRRHKNERRDSCTRVSQWSSVCPDEI